MAKMQRPMLIPIIKPSIIHLVINEKSFLLLVTIIKYCEFEKCIYAYIYIYIRYKYIIHKLLGIIVIDKLMITNNILFLIHQNVGTIEITKKER